LDEVGPPELVHLDEHTAVRAGDQPVDEHKYGGVLPQAHLLIAWAGGLGEWLGGGNRWARAAHQGEEKEEEQAGHSNHSGQKLRAQTARANPGC
jgi:hypothetical protein